MRRKNSVNTFAYNQTGFQEAEKAFLRHCKLKNILNEIIE